MSLQWSLISEPISILTSVTFMLISLMMLCMGVINSNAMQPKCPSKEEWIKKMQCIYTMEHCCCCHQVTSVVSESVRPIDGSPPGSTIPGILQARTLEWAAISFSNAWKWKVKVKSLSHVQLLATPWTTAYQAPLSMGFSRQEYWSGVPLPSLTMEYYSAIKNEILPFAATNGWTWRVLC